MPEASNTDHAQRFATKSAQASLGYANAGAFAGIFALNALFDAWTDACVEAAEPTKRGAKSWFRDPAKVDLFDPWAFWTRPSSSVFDPWSGQNWWMTYACVPAWWTSTTVPMPTAWPTAWAEFFPKPFSTSNLSFTRSPFWDTTAAALPMTWLLMSLGMPHAVAKPTAEANTAALEAMDSAQHLANDQMAAYTSALEPTSNAASCDQAFNALDAYALMFWPWLSETPATDAPEAA